eukprot:3367746-Alexandrium_andersonii.AAC.1
MWNFLNLPALSRAPPNSSEALQKACQNAPRPRNRPRQCLPMPARGTFCRNAVRPRDHQKVA